MGAYLDKRLSYGKHIDYKNDKWIKWIGILKKISHYVQEKSMKSAFKTFMKPYIEYGTLIWGEVPKASLEKIHKTVKKSIRVMCFKNKT